MLVKVIFEVEGREVGTVKEELSGTAAELEEQIRVTVSWPRFSITTKTAM
jgi:hypothetical protein